MSEGSKSDKNPANRISSLLSLSFGMKMFGPDSKLSSFV